MLRLEVDTDLILTTLEIEDAEDLFVLTERNRDRLSRWLPWVEETRSLADTQRFILSALEQRARRSGFQAAIRYREVLVGVIGFHRIDWPNRSVGVGYWIDAEYQGRGLVVRSCRKLLEYAFQELKLNRVEVRCAVDNVKSRAIPDRLGFVEEGVVRQSECLNGRFVDHVIYGMLASEWKDAVTRYRK